MRKMTRMVLISAVLATSGLTAKIANENYKAVVDNDERIHKAYENAKKPNKAAVLEAIMDATNAESDERIQNAVVIDPEEPKVVRIKTKVTTSAGVSPNVSTMDKKSVNKAEEFIEKVAHPADVVTNILNFSADNIPIQELTYETKNIFPEFEAVLPNTYDYPYRMTWPEGSFGNTMTPYYKTYYTVEYMGSPVEIWENDTPWNLNKAAKDYSGVFGQLRIITINGTMYLDQWKNGKYQDRQEITLGEPERKEIICGHDGVFSYTYDAGTYERRCKYQTFPAGVNPDNIRDDDNSTWLTLSVPSGSYDRIEGDRILVMGSSLFGIEFDENIWRVSHDRMFFYLFQEGNMSVGYWSSASDAKPIHDSLQAGNKFMTISEYNAENGTNYEWSSLW